MGRERRAVVTQERLPELEDDAGATELRKRVVGRPRDDERTVGKALARPMVVGDDDVEPLRPRLGELLDGGDAAVDGEHEATPLVSQARERLALDSVALLEAARQVPDDVGAELAKDEDGEGRGADAVSVVVAVDADSFAVGDGPQDRLAGGRHVAEAKRVVAGKVSCEEPPRLLGV